MIQAAGRGGRLRRRAGSRPGSSAERHLRGRGRGASIRPSRRVRRRRQRRSLLTSGFVTPVWCTSWRDDATTIIGPLLGLPDFPHLDLPRPQITTSHPNGYLWKRDHVDPWLGEAPVAWVDDDFTALDHTWAAERTARGRPTLLVQPNPRIGLQPGHLAEVREWARRVRPPAPHRSSPRNLSDAV
ncbi:hypothetical protein [Streptomyces sp. NBC_01435]|uniref:hypothetical protein n=1 Tax=Streptomyces sp. NBC_01435 TaxID=2903865 RepID=UPI003FCCD742